MGNSVNSHINEFNSNPNGRIKHKRNTYTALSGNVADSRANNASFSVEIATHFGSI